MLPVTGVEKLPSITPAHYSKHRLFMLINAVNLYIINSKVVKEKDVLWVKLFLIIIPV
jgi:hypothetical protein